MTQLAKEAVKSWSSTLRLPKSTFPARAAPVDLAKYLRRSTDDLYTWQSQERAGSRPFTIHDGPPYANGDLHVGHALNKILKDIINRTKLQEGKRIDYVPGWDCHGLPIEQKAFEHHGWSVGNKPNAVEVRKAAASFAGTAIEKQMADFRSWSVMGSWNRHWKTMDKSFELGQLEIFQAMARHDLIYRTHKPVYWSPSSRTALAEAELEYKEDHVSKAALVKFQLSNELYPDVAEPVSLLIWTTTPWTLPANQAIAGNRGLHYVIARSEKHGMLLLAASRLEAVGKLLSEELTIVQSAVDVFQFMLGSYQGLSAFGDIQGPIIHADFVSAEAGTGLVHCAPGHGMEDYEALQSMIRSGQISVKAPVDDEGKFTAEACQNDPQLLDGKSVFDEGNATVIAMLQQTGSLLDVRDYKHRYPYDWRTKQPIIVRATAQWFADLADVKKYSLKALENVDFQPKTGLSRLRAFVDNRSEWCISRQRSWGVPIPALYHKETGEPVLSNDSVSHILNVVRERGTDAWWSDAADDKAWILPELDSSQYVRGTDTMDVWFDSGTSWSYMSRESPMMGKSPIADVYLEGTDQHRGWFQSSLLTNVAYQRATNPNKTPTAPFSQLLTHGFTLDGLGKKMSKSIGNVITPMQIITGDIEPLDSVTTHSTKPRSPTSRAIQAPKKRGPAPGSLGSDALRLWVASSDWSKDVIVSETIVKTIHASLHKYRVTFKLLLGALEDSRTYDLNELSLSIIFKKLYKLDLVALAHLHDVSSTVRQAFDNFEYHKAVTAINKWVNTDLSGFYIEAVKDTLYCDAGGFNRRRSAQCTVFYILTEMQAMLAPLTPMLVEESWEHSPEAIRAGRQPPLQRTWDGPPPIWNRKTLKDAFLPLAMAINTACKAAQERARSQKKMGSSLESECLVHLPGVPEETFRIWENDLQEMLVVSYVKVFDAGVHYASRPENPEELYQWEQAADRTAPEDWHDRLRRSHKETWSYLEEFAMPDGKGKGFVKVYSPIDEKCPRCWRYVVEAKENTIDESVESQDPHDGLCERCLHVVTDTGLSKPDLP
jgi:isoleucyl-tRNA synthetase